MARKKLKMSKVKRPAAWVYPTDKESFWFINLDD